MNAPGPLPEASGEEPPKKIPGLPAAEMAAAGNERSLQKALAELDSLSRGETPEQLERVPQDERLVLYLDGDENGENSEELEELPAEQEDQSPDAEPNSGAGSSEALAAKL